MKKKALLAVVFAGGILNPQMQAVATESESGPDASIERVATFEEATPETRAYYLLQIANFYLSGGKPADAEQRFCNPVALKRPNANLLRKKANDLTSWTDQMARQSSIKSLSDQKMKDLAEKAIRESLKLVNRSSNSSLSLRLYYGASCLAKRNGSTDIAERCDTILEDVFKQCDNGSQIDPAVLSAARSILDSMSYNYVPINIREFDRPIWSTQKKERIFPEDNIMKGERLRLRGVAMTDHLPISADERRRAHRDMTLWYYEVGKTTLAEKQKQILFELVGIKDGRILFPFGGDCGNLVWWQLADQEQQRWRFRVACGTG